MSFSLPLSCFASFSLFPFHSLFFFIFSPVTVLCFAAVCGWCEHRETRRLCVRGWTCSSQVEEWVLSPVTPLKWTLFGRLHKRSNFLCKGVGFFSLFLNLVGHWCLQVSRTVRVGSRTARQKLDIFLKFSFWLLKVSVGGG